VATGFNDPWGIAVDGSGNLFVSEYQDNVQVKEILAAGGYTTVLPIGPSLSYPEDVEVDSDGNLFVLTAGDGDLREIVASGGYSIEMTLQSATPFRAFALDRDGTVFLAKDANSFLRKLELATPPSRRFATTAAGSTSSDSPRTLTAINSGNQTVHFSDVSYPVDFQERAGVPTDCTSSTDLSAGDTCTMTMHFSPLRTSANGFEHAAERGGQSDR
jgi:DNA-binding beta-propeller fold protein YncE